MTIQKPPGVPVLLFRVQASREDHGSCGSPKARRWVFILQGCRRGARQSPEGSANKRGGTGGRRCGPVGCLCGLETVLLLCPPRCSSRSVRSDCFAVWSSDTSPPSRGGSPAATQLNSPGVQATANTPGWPLSRLRVWPSPTAPRLPSPGQNWMLIWSRNL